jgi:hypothetical protein
MMYEDTIEVLGGVWAYSGLEVIPTLRIGIGLLDFV